MYSILVTKCLRPNSKIGHRKEQIKTVVRIETASIPCVILDAQDIDFHGDGRKLSKIIRKTQPGKTGRLLC